MNVDTDITPGWITTSAAKMLRAQYPPEYVAEFIARFATRLEARS